MKYTNNDIDLLFTYHNPQHIDPTRFTNIRSMANKLAKEIIENGGSDVDVSRSIQKLRECVFYAIASIAVPELSDKSL